MGCFFWSSQVANCEKSSFSPVTLVMFGMVLVLNKPMLFKIKFGLAGHQNGQMKKNQNVLCDLLSFIVKSMFVEF